VTLRRVWAFLGPSNDWRVLRTPRGPATGRQLARLERMGLHSVGRSLSQLEAAVLIDGAIKGEAAARRLRRLRSQEDAA
jgi:hypothetical protein